MAKRVESPSSINTFKQCRRKYYYQYIAQLPTLPNIHQVRGNIAHTTLEEFYNLDVSQLRQENYTQIFYTEIQNRLMQSWNKYKPQLVGLHLHLDQEKFYFEETMLMVMNWLNHFLQDFQTYLGKGMPLPDAFRALTPLREQHFQSDAYSVRGFVDAIHQVEDEVHIIDYKTNNTFEMKDSIRLQLAIYCLLYFEKNGRMPSKVGIFFLRHRLKWMKADEELLELARKEIGLIHAHTSSTENMQDYPRSISPLCRWSSGQCDFYDTCKPHEKEIIPISGIEIR